MNKTDIFTSPIFFKTTEGKIVQLIKQTGENIEVRDIFSVVHTQMKFDDSIIERLVTSVDKLKAPTEKDYHEGLQAYKAVRWVVDRMTIEFNLS